MFRDEWFFVGVEECGNATCSVTFSASCANVYALDGDKWVRV